MQDKTSFRGKQNFQVNPFHATDLFLYPLKTTENPYILTGYRKRLAP